MAATKVGFVSLGCPKNQIDTEVMLHHLADAGYEIVSEDIEADIVIVNTCAFIESAKQESIDSILDEAWLKKKLASEKLGSYGDIFLALCESGGEIQFYPKDE